MTNFGRTLRDALRRAHHVTVNLALTGRWAVMFGIVATLLAGTVEPPVRAFPSEPSPPNARLQFVVKSIHVRDDRDLFGSGEMRFTALVCSDGDKLFDCGEGPLARWDDKFDADSGDTRVLEHVVPQAGDRAENGATVEAGFPVYLDQHYHFYAYLKDEDEFTFDHMGYVAVSLDYRRDWDVGEYTVRSLHDDNSPGDFDITFEIRRTPLPDLVFSGDRKIESPDGDFYCYQFKNVGQSPSPTVDLDISTEIGTTITRFRHTVLTGLDVDLTTEYCVLRSELPSQQFLLWLYLDLQDRVPEMIDTNNITEVPFSAEPSAGGATRAPAASPAPTGPDVGAPPQPKPSTGDKAELTIQAIRVNGQAPSAPDACKPGKNVVTVVVKNTGAGDAGGFDVRLSVDGDDQQVTVDGLDAGQEQEVRFDGVALKKGLRTLRATADPDHAVDESKDDNNDLKVAVTC